MRMEPKDGAARLRRYVAADLVPAWLPRAIAPDGLFHERLGADLRPLDPGYRRLLSQCRQAFSFAEAAALGGPPEALEVARGTWSRTLAAYADPAGDAYRFALGDGAPLPSGTRHLYAYAFVTLADATLRRRVPGTPPAAPDPLALIASQFPRPGGGFHAALDERGAPRPGPLAQNPHMHLFEACLFRLDLGPDPLAGAMLATLADLLLDRFLDPADGTLREYPEDQPSDAGRGAVREVGHHYEWAWLIARGLRMGVPLARRAELEAAAVRLLEWAVGRVLEHPEGSTPDEVDAAGKVLTPTRRIWPVLEAVKAHAFAREMAWHVAGAAAAERRLWDLLFARYLREGTGTWTEVLDAELRPKVTDHPATTPYHIVMAARELEWLGRR
jgi:mannose-6-phosphate isomerase